MPPIIWVARAEVFHNNQLVRALGTNAYVTDLDPGDYAFGAEGIKPNNLAGTVGIEYKMHEDLANCIIYSARHLDQLRRMRATYDEVILMIGVRVVPNEEGLACTRTRRKGEGGRYETAYIPITPRQSPNATISFTRYLKHLYTIERLMGVRMMEVDSVQIAALKILALAEWWQTEPEKHSSWLAEYRPQSLMPGGEAAFGEEVGGGTKGHRDREKFERL